MKYIILIAMILIGCDNNPTKAEKIGQAAAEKLEVVAEELAVLKAKMIEDKENYCFRKAKQKVLCYRELDEMKEKLGVE